MAGYQFEALKKKYGGFHYPVAVISINDRIIEDRFSVSDIEVELTCGFEASAAGFSIFNAYQKDSGSFDFEGVKKYIFLGSKAEIFLGYEKQAACVFVGVVTRVCFLHDKLEIPCIRVTAMDVKGVMMAGSYSAQLKAACFSDAVKEIFERTAYEKLKAKDIIKGVHVTNTPDRLAAAQGAAARDRTLEMAAESDYEFIVKAAKKYNFEFYTECGNVYFRNAKADKTTIITIGPDDGLRSFEIAYDLTGLVEMIYVRAADISKAGIFTAKKKLNEKISWGNKAKPLLKGSRRVFLDATVTSREEAALRANALAEETAYRLGSLECELTGLPELMPGHFIELSGLGGGADNRFYLTKVRHVLSGDGSFGTQLTGKAAGMNVLSSPVL